MRLIEQYHETIDRDVLAEKLIERCGRTCYKTESKITEDSADDFIKMIVGRGHLSVLEHGALALVVPYGTYVGFKLADHETIKFLNLSENVKENRCIISGNLRAWFECMKAIDAWSGHDYVKPPAWYLSILFELWEYCAPAFEAYFGYDAYVRRYDKLTVGSGVRQVTEDEMNAKERWLHAFRTVRFVSNRGVTHELVRHRPASYSQESTRYVNYGGDDIAFIKPVWWHDDLWNEYVGKVGKLVDDKLMVFRGEPDRNRHEVFAMLTFFEGCCSDEAKYHQLLKWGWRVEQAREMLGNALKTEIVVTANLKEWRHILNLRTAKAAHPQIRALMKPLEPEIFTESQKLVAES